MSRAAILLERGVDIPLADGCVTRADVWRDKTRARSPAVLVRTPYGRDFEVPTPLLEPRRLVPAGFAVVVQDVRGRGDSAGEFDPFRQEAADGSSTAEWVAGQPWCDGRVAMAGSSYSGAAQWLAATQRPKSLKAIAPAFTAAEFGEGWMRRGGALELAFVASWVAGILAPPESLWLDDVERAYLDRDELANAVAWSRPWFDEATGPEYWASLAADPAKVTVPAISIGGWYDIFVDGTLRAHGQVGDHRSRLVIGPWAHDETLSHLIGDANLGVAGSGERVDLSGRMASFLLAALDDREPEGPPVLAYVLGAKDWLHLEQWPPAGRQYHLPLEKGELAFEPKSPPPSLGGRALRVATGGGPGYGVRDQSQLIGRPDVLALKPDLPSVPALIAGPVIAHLKVDVSTPGTSDWVCTLCVQRSNGRLDNLCEGITRLVSGEASVDVQLGSTCVALGRHEQLVLLVAGASSPRWDVRGTQGRRRIQDGSSLEVRLV